MIIVFKLKVSVTHTQQRNVGPTQFMMQIARTSCHVSLVATTPRLGAEPRLGLLHPALALAYPHRPRLVTILGFVNVTETVTLDESLCRAKCRATGHRR